MTLLSGLGTLPLSYFEGKVATRGIFPRVALSEGTAVPPPRGHLFCSFGTITSFFTQHREPREPNRSTPWNRRR